MSKHVPLISSSLAGPLGIKHLPRLWQKVSLKAAGKLHDDYPDIGGGYDAMVLDALQVNHGAFRDFVAGAKPSYFDCEKWISENGAVDAAAIATLNRQIDQYHHTDETRSGILSAAGVEDNGSYPDAPTLNNYDDWTTFHSDVIAGG